jgi:hypothetical protein
MKVAFRSPASGTLSAFWHGYIASSYSLLSLFSFHLLCKCPNCLHCFVASVCNNVLSSPYNFLNI